MEIITPTCHEKRKVTEAFGFGVPPPNCAYDAASARASKESPAIQILQELQLAKKAKLQNSQRHLHPVPSPEERTRFFARPKSEYKHQPLHDGEIRLLRLQTATVDGGQNVEGSFDVDEVREWCLEAHVLQDALLYAALSYTWGSPDPMEVLTTNGKGFQVRERMQSELLMP